ncbi:MAG: hypothetical protein K5978_04025 [Campylobacter sp.]|nr:hypothetical protein [Campylobacter sp.]
MIKTLFVIYLCFFLVLLLCGIFLGKAFLLSSQVAFFSSLLIIFASYKSYERKILSRLNDESYLAKLKENDDDDDIQQSQKDEQGEKSDKIKKSSVLTNLKNVNLSTASFPYRLIAYRVLFVGFLALQRQGNLSISGLLIGLGAMPLGALIFGITKGKNVK